MIRAFARDKTRGGVEIVLWRYKAIRSMKHRILEEQGTYWGDHWGTLEPSVAKLIGIREAKQHETHAQRMRGEHLLLYGDPRVDPFCCKPNARILMQARRALGLEQNFVSPGKK